MTEQPVFGVPQWTMGDRLAKALDYAGMSRADMAVYLEVSPNTVTNYTSGKTRVPGSTLRLWAMRTGVPREWLESGKVPTANGPDDLRARRDSNPQPSDPKVLVSQYAA